MISVLHSHLVAGPVGQDPADALHLRKPQVLTDLNGQGVKPPQYKPGRQAGAGGGKHELRGDRKTKRVEWSQPVPHASQIPRKWVRSRDHESTPGVQCLPAPALLPAPLGLLYLSSSTWMVSCLYLYFSRLRMWLRDKSYCQGPSGSISRPWPFHPAVNTLSTHLRILAIGKGDPDVIVPDGIEYTKILTHAHEAVGWKPVQETLSEGGRLRRARESHRASSVPAHPCPAPPPSSPAIQANPEQTLLHVWPVLMSCSLDALLHSLGQLPQLLDLPQVLIRLLALFLGEGEGARGRAS